MMDLSRIKAVILDFDNVWYHETDLPNDEIYNLCDNAAAVAACDMIQGLEYQQSLELAKQSYAQYRDGISAHVAYMVDEHGYDQQQARDLMFEAYHAKKFAAMVQDHEYIFEPCEERIQQLDYLVNHVALGILSHSSAEEWIVPFLERNQTKQYIAREYILDYKDFDYVSKADRADGVTMLMERMGVQPYETIFVDDHAPNLLVAKEEHPDLTVIHKKADMTIEDANINGVVRGVNNLNDLLIQALAKQPNLSLRMK